MNRGEFLTEINIVSLGAGTTKDCSFKYFSQSSLSGKFVIAVLDSYNQVTETDENNNTSVGFVP
jgi:subtilase family serine protease